MPINKDFSKTLQTWLSDNKTKTVGDMLSVLGDKSFAFIFLVLMIIPATPLPTGGITHVFELIVALIALQLVIGRNEIWLPQKLRRVSLGKNMQQKALPFLMRRIQFAEKYSRPRLAKTLETRWFKSQLGLFVLLFTASAFFAPPFSGLDTLPSLGVVFIAIGIILSDALIIGAGYVIGVTGVALALTLGAGLVTSLLHFVK